MNIFKWHKIPHWLHYFFIPFAAAAWAFDCCKTKIVKLEPLQFSREYDFYFFRLWETPTGEWYIKIG